jgi:phospholipid N-methyltransferase
MRRPAELVFAPLVLLDAPALLMTGAVKRYYETYLQKWDRVGAVAPSSRFLARAITNHVEPSDSILEIGAGSGAFTRVLAGKVPDEHLHVLEVDPERERTLRQYASNVYLTGALDFLDAPPLDLAGFKAVSGLPLLNFEEDFRRTLWQRLFREAGVRSIRQFTYSPVPLFEEEWLADRGLTARRTAFVLLNLPPAFVWEFTRASDGPTGPA